MKSYLTIALAIVSVLLAIALTMIKMNDTAQLDTATGTITDYSNRLDSAQSQIAVRDGSLLTLSNSLAECGAAALAVSNELTQAQATGVLQTEQIAKLNRQVADSASANEALNRNVASLTNQLAGLMSRQTQTETNLAKANETLVQAKRDYALLQNRFLRDVAERTVVERRFNNLAEVQAQAKKLQKYPTLWVTPESIYASLNVEVPSNGVAHVIAPE